MFKNKMHIVTHRREKYRVRWGSCPLWNVFRTPWTICGSPGTWI